MTVYFKFQSARTNIKLVMVSTNVVIISLSNIRVISSQSEIKIGRNGFVKDYYGNYYSIQALLILRSTFCLTIYNKLEEIGTLLFLFIKLKSIFELVKTSTDFF